MANCVKQFLSHTFNERIISRSFSFAWPPRSPDIAPPDYWLWGSIKHRVYANHPTTIQDLKDSIQREISIISPEELKKVVENMVVRLHAIILANGGLFEHLM